MEGAREEQERRKGGGNREEWGNDFVCLFDGVGGL